MTTLTARSRETRRVAISSLVGTTVETYDFHVYAVLAALVFNEIFFSSLDPLLGTTLALTTLIVGYVGRLAGGLLFGHFGDRYGRKSILVLTMALMGVATGLIGLLPSYAQIGVIAPVLLVLLRIVQGLALGGEFSGAALMSAEHSGQKRRGFATSMVSIGLCLGGLMAYGSLGLVSLMSSEQLLSWGWRLPFLFSFVLLLIGLYVRTRVSESPVFQQEAAAAQQARAPLAGLLRENWRTVLRAVAIGFPASVANGIFTVFVIAYATANGQSASGMALVLIVALVVGTFAAPAFAALSDRIGRKPVLMGSTAAVLVLAYPALWAINSGTFLLIMIVVTVMTGLVIQASYGIVPVLYNEMFPTRIRYTGVSLAYQLTQIIGLGVAPAVASSLLILGGGGTNTVWIGVYLLVAAVVGLVGLRLTGETQRSDLAAVRGSAGPEEQSELTTAATD